MGPLIASYYEFRMRQRFGLLTKWEILPSLLIRWAVFVVLSLAVGAVASLAMLMMGVPAKITGATLDDTFFVALGAYSLHLTRFYLRQKPARRLSWVPPILLSVYWGVFFVYPIYRLILLHL